MGTRNCLLPGEELPRPAWHGAIRRSFRGLCKLNLSLQVINRRDHPWEAQPRRTRTSRSERRKPSVGSRL